VDTQGGALHVLRLLRRRWWIIAVCVVVATTVALASALSEKKTYKATAKLLFRDATLAQTFFGSQTLGGANDPERQAETNLGLASLDTVADLAAAKIGGISGEAIRKTTTVKPVAASDIAAITAVASSPRRAAQIANGVANAYIDFRRRADQAKVLGAEALAGRAYANLSPLQRQGPEGQDLQKRINELKIFASLQTGNAELVQPAAPPDHSAGPRPLRDSVVGFLLGLLAGLAAALVLGRLDRRLRDVEELEQSVPTPVLALVPKSRAVRRGASVQSLGPAGESLNLLRMQLRYFNVDRAVRSVMVTSTSPQEGKSTVSWLLAAMAAGAGGKVLLVEADLRRPSMAEARELRRGPGLTELLSHQVVAKEAIQHVTVRQDRDVSAAAPLDVIVAGAIQANPAEYLESEAMKELLREMHRRYELIVIDTAPALAVPDPIAILNDVDGVLLVARFGVTVREHLQRLYQDMKGLDARVLGVVGNGAPSPKGYYGYGYGSPPEDEVALRSLGRSRPGKRPRSADGNNTGDRQGSPLEAGDRI
jgi:capsular exopolysaccharide synthesis family protein